MRILVLTHRLPFAPNRGDRIRAFHIVRVLAARHDVHVLSLVHDRAEDRQADVLRRIGVRVTTALVPRARNLARGVISLVTSTPLTHVLLDSPRLREAFDCLTADEPPDVVIAYCSGIAPLALAPRRPGAPWILDLVDVDSAKWAAFARTHRFPLAWIFRREARLLAAFEAQAARAAFATTVVNDRERDTLLQLCPRGDVRVVPNGIDVESLAPGGPPTREPRVIFTAVFDYAPNVSGAVWFAGRVWPRVRAAVPRARLTLAGASPSRAVRRLARTDPSIEVTGPVADMSSYLWRSAVAVAPLHQARGVQNKVLEAAAAGLPCVVTRAVWEGLPDEVLPACRLAEREDEFADAVIGLLTLSPEGRRREAAHARLTRLAWPLRLSPLVDLVDAAASHAAARL